MRNQLKIHTYLLYRLYVGMSTFHAIMRVIHVTTLRSFVKTVQGVCVNMDVNKLDQMAWYNSWFMWERNIWEVCCHLAQFQKTDMSGGQ